MKAFWVRGMILVVIGGLFMTTSSSFAASSLSDTELDAVSPMGELEGVQESLHSPDQLSDPTLQHLEASRVPMEIWPFQIIFHEPVHTPIPGAFPSSRRSHIIESGKRRYPDLFPNAGDFPPLFRSTPPKGSPGFTR